VAWSEVYFTYLGIKNKFLPVKNSQIKNLLHENLIDFYFKKYYLSNYSVKKHYIFETSYILDIFRNKYIRNKFIKI
jgi:hypothetical protein